MKYNKQVKTGVVVILAIALFIYGFNFLKGKDIFSTSLNVYAVYDHIDGLTANNTVQVNGFKVGTVREIKIDPKTGKLLVHFIITDKNVKITDSARAEIISGGLLGNKEILLLLSGKGKTLEDGDTLFGFNEVSLKDQVNEQMLPLKVKVESLVGSIDSMVQIFSGILNENTMKDIEASFTNMKLAMESFKNVAQNLDTTIASSDRTIVAIIQDFKQLSGMMAANKDTLAMAIANFKNISDSLAASNLKTTINEAGRVMTNAADFLAKLNAEGGARVLLGEDSVVLKDLRRTNARMEFLVEDISRYPGRYIKLFGKKKPNKKEEAERQRKLDSINRIPK
ncbi:MAG: MlaD family protein [Bacteroidetes bacterium]|nr:MlaD family protein [Bacteroidota bacterium]